jgi:hypothetical protein
MSQKKKLQVFVSSTYTDLLEERQAAVQAILTAGHIPAGMELFAAGDEAQMDVIKRWIDESDVYMLILGGRYGSIEPKSQKSYIQLEYEYAVEKGKPLFAVVIDDSYLEKKAKKKGLKIVERDHQDKLKEFRAQVESRMVRFWSDPRDITIAIHETMSDFGRREDLVGWIPGDEAINTGAVAEEIARLAKENSALKEEIANLSAYSTTYNGLSFEEMYDLLSSYEIELSQVDEDHRTTVEEFAQVFSVNAKVTYLHFYWVISGILRDESITNIMTSLEEQRLLGKLIDFGLVFKEVLISSSYPGRVEHFKITDSGKQFLIRLRLEKSFTKYEKFIYESNNAS